VVYAMLAFVWLGFATQLAMLAFPVSSLLLRTSYLDRPITTLIRFLPVMAGLLFFLWNVLIVRLVVSEALLWSSKIVVSGFLLMHLAKGMRDLNIPLINSKWIGAYYLGQRSVSLVGVRLRDIGYSFSVRWRRRGTSRAALVTSVTVAAVTELLLLKSEFERTLAARGGFPESLDWTVPERRKALVLVGDLALLVVVGLFLWNDAANLIPLQLRLAVTKVPALLGSN
jgi:hypothetical protein